jgi:hypothetical protein
MSPKLVKVLKTLGATMLGAAITALGTYLGLPAEACASLSAALMLHAHKP